MTTPSEYQRLYRFVDWEANHPTAPIPGSQIDAELDQIQAVLASLHPAELQAVREQIDYLSARVEKIERVLRREARL